MLGKVYMFLTRIIVEKKQNINKHDIKIILPYIGNIYLSAWKTVIFVTIIKYSIVGITSNA